MFTPQVRDSEKLSAWMSPCAIADWSTLDDRKRPVRQVSYYEDDGRKYVAGVVDDDGDRPLVDGR